MGFIVQAILEQTDGVIAEFFGAFQKIYRFRSDYVVFAKDIESAYQQGTGVFGKAEILFQKELEFLEGIG